RKSFTLGVFITDPYGRYVDLTDCSLNIVAKREPYSTSDDSGNLFYDNPAATIEYPQDGYGRFDIQASQLDHPPGEYPFVIVLRARGYSSVIVKGVIEILANPEYTSADEDFEE